MSPTMASSFCVFAAMSGATGRPSSAGGSAVPGRSLSTTQGGKGKRAVVLPLAASVVTTETPTPAPAPPARPVVDAPRRRGGRGTGEHAAWKSIRQERWEGALELEGELPLWLVGTTTIHLAVVDLISGFCFPKELIDMTFVQTGVVLLRILEVTITSPIL